MLRKKSEPQTTERGIALDVYEEGGRVIRVEVTTDAIEEFYRRRDVKRSTNDITGELLEAILDAADDLVNAAPGDVKAVRVVSSKLNP